MQPVVAAFAPVLGLPSWSVKKGDGSFITLEFGEPELMIGESFLGLLAIEGAPERAMRRAAYVHGQWHLWIYCCFWSVRLDDLQLAHNESDDITIARALSLLNGQALTEVQTEPETGATCFTFDLGCTLSTTPAPAGIYSSYPVEQWNLYQPSGDVLSVREDGTYADRPGTTKPTEAPWAPLPTR